MTVPPTSWAAAVYPAVELFKERSLLNGASFVTGEAAVWTRETADDFYERFVVKEDLSGASFLEKLSAQLTGAGRKTVLLGADLVGLCTLPVHDMSADTKRKRLATVLGLLDPTPEIDPLILEAFTTGIARYGQGNTQIWKFMRYAATFAREWSRLDEGERERRLADPWEWKALLSSLDGGAGAQAAAMLHILFPATFEPIVSSGVKEKVATAFRAVPGVLELDDPDRRLEAVRAALEPVLDPRFQFWGPVVEPVWSGKPTDPSWTFASFARKARELENFDELEMDYKLELADRLAAARAALLSDDIEWLVLLKRAFGDPNNLTSWRQHASFLDWCESEPDLASRALRVIWEPNEGGDSEFSEFLSLVPDDAIPTPGARANILSYLLGALDRDGWAIYKPTPADSALALCGREQAETSDVLGRMSRFTQLLDELRVRVVALGGPATSRLEAQGMAWIVVDGTIPEAWSAADRAALEEFRRGASSDISEAEPPGANVPEHAWLVRGANVDGENLVPTWIEEGYVSIGWSEMGDLDAAMTLDELREAARAVYPDESPGAWGAWAGNLFRFFSRMSIGDLVVTVSADDVYVGRIASDVHDEPVFHASRGRKVEWINPMAPFSRAGILKTYPSLFARMRARLTVTDLTQDVESVRALIGMGVRTGGDEFAGLPPASDELATTLFVPKDWIQRDILDLLAAKRQLIFYGPPGTGKTYVAQRIAEHLAQSGGDFELVQFHPSYSYEDFFEGFRPTQAMGDTGVLYALRDGPLKRIARLASADPAHPYLLIVDEINRGNIPKIFGELLFLLEYRDRFINLQYSDEPFSLPPNLFVIGTMNTADRSIALVDAALRRRFFFVPFLPTEAPVQDVLRRWLQEHGHDELPALLLDELNKRIAKDEIAIGPSYFMNGDVSRAGLRQVWRHAILPLLDEHYYGTKVDVRTELGFEACLSAVTTPEAAELAADALAPEAAETANDATAIDPA